MDTKKINIELLTDYLKDNEVEFSIDENPTPSKLQKIKDAMRRKDALITNSVNTYQLSLD